MRVELQVPRTIDAPCGGRSLVERFNEVTGTNRIGSTSYDFDAVGNLTDLTHLDAVDAVFSDFHFDWNLASEMTARTEDGQVTSYIHDNAGQLTSANHVTQTDEVYNYDANGNRQAAGLTIEPNNQVLADGTYTYLYDAEGNLIRRTTAATGSYTVYQYDHRNRMTDATNYTSAGTVTQDVDFAYDVFDRRITKWVDADGAGPLAPVTTHTVYDGQHAWADLDAAGNVVARYLFGPSIDEIAARWISTSGTAWYVTDQLGSVRYLLNATGAIVNSIVYDSFGNIVSFTDGSGAAVSQLDPQSSSLLRFTFTGREFDLELGFYYYRARYYDAQLGRFISQDPIGFAAGDANLYRYVSNSPLTFVDPSGNDLISYIKIAAEDAQIGGAAAGAIFGAICGFAEGFTAAAATGSSVEDAVQAGLEKAAEFAAMGAYFGALLATAAPFYQAIAGGVFLGLGAILTITTEEPWQTKVVRTACLYFVARGTVTAARQSSVPKPIMDFLITEHGSVPHPAIVEPVFNPQNPAVFPTPDNLPPGRMPPLSDNGLGIRMARLSNQQLQFNHQLRHQRNRLGRVAPMTGQSKKHPPRNQ